MISLDKTPPVPPKNPYSVLPPEPDSGVNYGDPGAFGTSTSVDTDLPWYWDVLSAVIHVLQFLAPILLVFAFMVLIGFALKLGMNLADDLWSRTESKTPEPEEATATSD